MARCEEFSASRGLGIVLDRRRGGYRTWKMLRLWRPVASLQYTVLLVQWVNCSLPAWGATVWVPGMHPQLQLNLILLLAMSRYIGDPDMISDHQLG